MKSKYILTLKEVFGALASISTSDPEYNINFLNKIGKYNKDNRIGLYTFVAMLAEAYDWNMYELDSNKEGFGQFDFFEWNETAVEYKLTTSGSKIVDAVFRQYGDCYCAHSEDLAEDKVIPQAILLLDDFMNVLNMTYQKYSNLLNIYDTKTQDLLHKVESIESGTNSSEGSVSSSGTSSGSGTSVNKYKDTPQSAVNVVNDDNYNSNVEVNTDSNETSSEDSSESTLEETREITRSEDRDTLMARIDEIQQSYQKVLERWIKEFDPLFWEEI